MSCEQRSKYSVQHPCSMSHITHPISCVLRSIFHVPNHTSRVQHPMSYIPHLKYHVQHPTSYVRCPTSHILHPISHIPPAPTQEQPEDKYNFGVLGTPLSAAEQSRHLGSGAVHPALAEGLQQGPLFSPFQRKWAFFLNSTKFLQLVNPPALGAGPVSPCLHHASGSAVHVLLICSIVSAETKALNNSLLCGVT